MATLNQTPTGFSPLNLQSRSLGIQLAAILVGSVILALSSHLEVPMYPVPMTMQTFAVAMVGALYGWRLGGATIIAWLLQGAVGFPVLAGGASGLHHFAGPTGGYLLAFPIAGMVMGWLAERGWNGRHMGLAFLGMLIANLLCLVLGVAWLSLAIGLKPAIIAGALPFLTGAVAKSALAAMVLRAMSRGDLRAKG